MTQTKSNNTMKTRIILYLPTLLLSLLASCQDEDKLQATHTPSPFALALDNNETVADLQRAFHEQTDCYLIFTDTLRHDYLGTDENGQPYYKPVLVNLAWNMTSVSDKQFRFDYIATPDRKQEAIRFVEEQLLPRVSNLLPYSLLLVDAINQYNKEDGVYTLAASPAAYSCINCLALAIRPLWQAGNDPDALALDLCCQIIFDSWGGDPDNSYRGSLAWPFLEENFAWYDYEKEYYYGLDIPNGLGEESSEPMRQIGFIVNPHETLLPSALEDAVSYIKACLTMTDEDFHARYADYPVILEKYTIIKPLVDQTGIQF